MLYVVTVVAVLLKANCGTEQQAMNELKTLWSIGDPTTGAIGTVSDEAYYAGAHLCSMVNCNTLQSGAAWNTGLDKCLWKGVICGAQWKQEVVPATHPFNISGLPHATASVDITGVSDTSVVAISLRSTGITSQNGIPSLLSCLPNLIFLELGQNPSLTGPLTFPPGLRYISTAGCNIGSSIPAFPSTLSYINLYGNILTGTIPPVSGLSSLGYLELGKCPLTGTLPTLPSPNTHFFLAITETQITGEVPSAYSSSSSALWLKSNQLSKYNEGDGSFPLYLDLSRNRLQSEVPAMPKLTIWFDFSQNFLTGTLAENFFSGKQLPLFFLMLQNNRLQGTLPDSWGADLSKVKVMIMSDNRFNGSLPNSWGGNMTDATSVLIANMPTLSGTLPDSWSRMNSLGTLGLWENALSGTIPSGLGTIEGLTTVWVHNNQFTGSIPNTFASRSTRRVYDKFEIRQNQLTGTLPGIRCKELSVGNNRLSGTLPEEVFHSGLVEFSAQNNLFTGSLPGQIQNAPNILKLWLFGNRLSGDIPWQQLGATSIRYLALGNNKFTGPLSPNIFTLGTLEQLDLSYNEFTGVLPAATSDTAMQVLLLMGNRLSGGFPFLFFKFTQKLTTLRLDDNMIEGTLIGLEWAHSLQTFTMARNRLTTWSTVTVDITLGIFDVQLARYPSLTKLDVSDNRLSIDELGLVQLKLELFFAALEILQIGGNPISGVLPESWGELSQLRTLNVTNTLMVDESCNTDMTCLPSWLKRSSGKVDVNIEYACYFVEGSERYMSVSIDDMYFNNTNCLCKSGFYGEQKQCTACLQNAVCPGNDKETEILAQPGYYGVPDPTNPQEFIRCLDSNPATTSCVPQNSSMALPCEEGYLGRLCSECAAGFTQWSNKCIKCPSPKWTYGLIFAAIICGLFIYIGYIFQQLPTRVDGTARVAIFYIQMIALTSGIGVTIRSAGNGTTSTTNMVFFEPPAFSCILIEYNMASSYSFYEESAFSCLKFVLVLGMMGVLFAIGHVLLNATGKGTETRAFALYNEDHPVKQTRSDKWLAMCTRATILVLITIYPGVCKTVINVLNCKKDNSDSNFYLEFAPYVECYNSKYNEELLVPALLALLLITIGQPLCFFILLLSIKNKQDEPTAVERYGALFFLFKPSSYFWEVVCHFRGFFVAVLLSLPPEPAYRAWSASIILLFTLSIHVHNHPFKNALENYTEELVYFTLCITYTGIGYHQVAVVSNEPHLGTILIVINLLTIIVLLCSLFSRHVLYKGLVIAKNRGFNVSEDLIRELSPAQNVVVPITVTEDELSPANEMRDVKE